jgi:hypothetical protein
MQTDSQAWHVRLLQASLQLLNQRPDPPPTSQHEVYAIQKSFLLRVMNEELVAGESCLPEIASLCFHGAAGDHDCALAKFIRFVRRLHRLSLSQALGDGEQDMSHDLLHRLWSALSRLPGDASGAQEVQLDEGHLSRVAAEYALAVSPALVVTERIPVYIYFDHVQEFY